MAGGGGGGVEGDVELNIAPIVDCFTVLIAYMLVSMSYIQLSIFEAGVAANAPPDAQPAEPPPPDAKVPLVFSIEVSEANQLQLKLTGGKPEINELATLEPVNGNPDTDALAKKVTEMKAAHPDLAEANLSASNTIRYRTVIRVIQAVKSVLPKVFLASN